MGDGMSPSSRMKPLISNAHTRIYIYIYIYTQMFHTLGGKTFDIRE